MVKVETIEPPERCPECGFDKLYRHGSRKQLIMDLPIRLKRVGLQLNRRRYRSSAEIHIKMGHRLTFISN